MAERIRYPEIDARREFSLALICDLGDRAIIMSQRPDIKVWGEEGANSLIERVLSDRSWTWRADSIDSTGSLVKTHTRVMSGELTDFSNCRATILLSGFAPGNRSPSLSLIHSPFLPGRPTLLATPEGAWVIDDSGAERLLLLGDGPRSLADVDRFDCVSWREARPNFREFLEAKLPDKRVDRRLSMGAVALRAVDLSVFPGPVSNPHDVASGAHIGYMAGATVQTLGGRRFEEVDWLHGPIDGVVVAATNELAGEVVRAHALQQAA